MVCKRKQIIIKVSKEEINLRLREGNVSVPEGLEIIASYIYLRKNQKVRLIPPRNPIEMTLFNKALNHISLWAS
jgi:hypothetical protein